MYAKHTVNGQILEAILGAWIVAGLSWKFGERGWKIGDKLCLGAAAIAITLWQIFDEATLGIAISLTVLMIGAIPTFLNAFQDPSKEDRTSWTIYFLSCVFAMLAIPQWTVADAAQPTTFFLIETVMVMILYLRPGFLKKATV